jgi:hypothetical protein
MQKDKTPTTKLWPRTKKIHYAKGIREDGAVSALCFVSPRAINLKVATWTNRPEAVTCGDCQERMLNV